jgi:hypothetical protein
MADALVITDTTYAGEAASQFITKAITANDTINGGNAYVKDGIKKKFTIPRWDSNYETLIQDRAATPTSAGTMTVTGQVIDPQDYMIYMEFNPRDFEDHWFATQLDPTLIDRSLPNSAESVVVQGVMERHQKYMNKIMWTGNNTLAAPSIYRYFDGWLTKASDSTTSNKVVSPTTLTAGIIQAELLKGRALLPEALRFDQNMKIYMSYNTYDLYIESQIAQTYKGIDVTTNINVTPTRFWGLEVVKIADFPANTYLYAKGMATTESNLWVGMNSVADEGLTLRQLQNNSELYFVKMLMKLDVNFGWDEEVVYYGPVINP